MRTIQYHFEYKLPKKAVYEWWTDLSGKGYVGDSMKSLKPVGKEGEKTLVETKWKLMGIEKTMVEKLSVLSEDHWIWEPAAVMGIHVVDDFSLQETPEGGTQLNIRTEITPRGLKGKFTYLIMGRMFARSFRKEWEAAHDACLKENAESLAKSA